MLAVALPSLVYTATVMTENLYYPLALVVMWATLLALERPTWRNTALVLVALGLALATRTQAVALAAGIVFAPVALAVIEGSRLARVRASWRLYALFGGAAVIVLAGQVAAGGSRCSGLLGAYGVVGDRSYDVGTVLRYWLWHAEELTLYLGVVPVAATLVLLGRARRLPARLQEHLAVTVSFSVWTTLVVAAFASEFAGRIQERNTFAIAPLFLVALVAWVAIGAPRPWPSAAVATALAVVLVVAFPYTRFIGEPAKSDTLAILPIWSAFGHLPFDSIWFSVLLGALALAAVFLLVPARWAVLVPLAVLLWFGVVGTLRVVGPSRLRPGGSGSPLPGHPWRSARLDRHGAPRRARRRGSCGQGLTDRFTVNQNEFFNRAVGPVYYIGGPSPGNLPETGISVDPRGRRSCGAPTDRR